MVGTEMADNSLPRWFLWVGGITSAFAAWMGLLLSLRREWQERPQLKVLFRASPFARIPTGIWADRITVTVTNIGAHPVSLDSIVYVLGVAKDGSHETHRERAGMKGKVERGDPVSQEFGFGTDYLFEPGSDSYGEPMQIESVAVTLIDSTGRRWKPNWRERRQLRSVCAEAWPNSFRMRWYDFG